VFKPHWIVNVAGILVFIGLMVYAIREFKTKNNGFLKLGQAIKIGLGIAVVAAVIGIIYQLLLMYVIEPEYMTKMLEFSEQTMLEKYPEMDEAQMEVALNMSKKFTSPGMLAAMALAMNLFCGLIISLIAGLIMKKEQNEY
jgi:predicted histidine transporter YuiF (NhaC family)